MVGFSHACLQNGASIIPQVYLNTFGKECCLPSKIAYKRCQKEVILFALDSRFAGRSEFSSFQVALCVKQSLTLQQSAWDWCKIGG